MADVRSAGLSPSVPVGRRHAPPRESISSKPVLFQPSTQIRYRRAGGGRGGDAPQYPPVALAIDYILPDGFTGPASLEITDSTGRVVRAVQAAAGGGRGQGGDRGADDPDMRGGGERGRGGAAPMTLKAGHNRYLWDYRWNGGPLAAPGKYSARLIIGTGGPSSDPRPDEELRGEGRSRRAERRHHRRRPRRAAELPAAGARHGGRSQPAAHASAAGDAEGERPAAAVAGPRRVGERDEVTRTRSRGCGRGS